MNCMTIRSDPYENVNIAGSNQAIIKRMLPIWSKGNTGLYDNGQAEDKNQQE